MKDKDNLNKISLANSGNFEFFVTNFNELYLSHVVTLLTFKFSWEKSGDKVFNNSKSQTFYHVNRCKSKNIQPSYCYTNSKNLVGYIKTRWSLESRAQNILLGSIVGV